MILRTKDRGHCFFSLSTQSGEMLIFWQQSPKPCDDFGVCSLRRHGRLSAPSRATVPTAKKEQTQGHFQTPNMSFQCHTHTHTHTNAHATTPVEREEVSRSLPEHGVVGIPWHHVWPFHVGPISCSKLAFCGTTHAGWPSFESWGLCCFLYPFSR